MSVTPVITQQEIAQLVELHEHYRAEAVRCADAGAFTAATVMMASALETELLCAACMAEHVLRSAELWPRQNYSKWSLGLLLQLAEDAGWFSEEGPSMAGAVEAIKLVRTCCVHPAAYMREGGWQVNETLFAGIFEVLIAADRAIGEVVSSLPDPPR